MFDLNIIESFTTAGVFVLYEGKFAFMIGPDETGKRLGIARLGGHIEKGEDIFECIERELEEEASIKVKLINSPKTFYKEKWNNKSFEEFKVHIPLEINPLLICGNQERSTAIFLAYAEQEPKPASEAYGIIFLKEEDIKEICTRTMQLRELAKRNVKLIEQKEINYDMETYAGVHLKFLYDLINSNDDLIYRYINKKL